MTSGGCLFLGKALEIMQAYTKSERQYGWNVTEQGKIASLVTKYSLLPLNLEYHE